MAEDRSRAYARAGVDINAGNSLVPRFKAMVAATKVDGVVGDIGGFGGLFRPGIAGMKDPVLVSSTDGVGTKLKLAQRFGRHDTVGIDLVAMSVNDILVQGARPMFFLDYFATGKLDVDLTAMVVQGVAEGCRQGGCALLGGETAEMPDMYAPGDYDLAGFAVGLADACDIVDGSKVRPGDVILGLGSTGVHSNGYSLVRKLLDKSGLQGGDPFPGAPGRTVADVLLAPTRIYVKDVVPLFGRFAIKGMAHITGGGFFDNIPRVLPDDAVAAIDFGSWTVPPVFGWLKEIGGLGWDEMLQIFNTGIGYVMIVDAGDADAVLAAVAEDPGNVPAFRIGRVVARRGDEEQVRINY